MYVCSSWQVVLVVLIVGANFGLSFATAALSQKVK
jgi:hypothetical protein